MFKIRYFLYLENIEKHVWDDSGVGAIDKVVLKLRQNHGHVVIKGLNSASQKLVDKLAMYKDENAKVTIY